ncbi:Transglycosylase SLT domain-containing protein [Tistlia consotensis]|uniref:Transglycosylase SLT domain-containing protein n=1 Tax=Tistlia consotensis USBA 355 TaxID=560819 RepID=A0A1Y6CPX0_9PROT|nr:lytic transglycosylase domain-containing protein [Tistlia consotensis]SMF81652.1 Transglycosylase SLT domain-containing protein [Tistlia consotensis USBA 355]SNS24137.1 Transglycosylase SLT domain-containing protein [Tistlia consotensis]
MDRLSPLIFAAAVIVTPAEAAAVDQFQAHIKEASQHFGIPAGWIEAVIMAESKGDHRAVSPKGAMGLMQLMPETWAELRDQLDFGADPFDPPTNILAGTAYLRAMQDRFGYPGLFAAYNAGPGRYEAHLHDGKPLPAETRAYVARIAEMLTDAGEFALHGTISPPTGTRNPDQIASGQRLFFSLSTTKNEAAGDENSVPNGELFVPLSTRKPDEK